MSLHRVKHRIKFTAVLLWLLTAAFALAQDAEAPAVPYFQSAAFNVPVIAGWENQSTAEIAQFHHAAAQAHIRTALVAHSDPQRAAETDLRALLAAEIPAPRYQGKVNLADGTWTALVYALDEAVTASVMARAHEQQSIVISFVESNPAAQVAMLTLAQSDESAVDASPEMAAALAALSAGEPAGLGAPQTVALSSGEWLRQEGAGVQVMGRVFGNDSYVAAAVGAVESLSELANAYNNTLLGFFITPDNSDFLALGLGASFAVLAALLLSWLWRARGVRKDLALLQELQQAGG